MNIKTEWFALDDAADYLGIGKTVLYTMAREGRIPANKVGKKWTFDRAQLDLWMRGNQPIETYFKNVDCNIVENLSLRDPQREAYIRTLEFFQSGKNKAILQIPVGCGKSGMAAILPFGIAEGRVLVIAPNLTIKEGLYESMDITNRPKCFWRKTGVLLPDQMLAGPLACTLDSGNISVANKCHFVITNVQQLATSTEKWLQQFSKDFFDMIIVDEAHHSAADSWAKVIDYFPDAKIIHLTATPFRSDRKEIDGELVYRYPFRSATLKGYIKRLKASYVAPSEIELGFSSDSGKIYSLDEVLKLKEEDWFSRGIALAPACNVSIVNSSLQKLEELRQTGTRHQLIAVACTINHAKDIRSLYAERNYEAAIIHSKQDAAEKEKVMLALKNGTLDCIVQVQMLGEGFDHPHLSVAAIFRPFRTLAPYIQFVGRIMRVIVQNEPAHPDNLGHIVTHIGMNLDQRVKEFKEFERDDQAFWDKVIGGAEPELPSNVMSGDTRLSPYESNMVVRNEIIEGLWEEDFSTQEDAHVVAALKEQMVLLGLDPSHVEEIVKKSKYGNMVKRPAAESFPIQPQRALAEARKRLNEQGQRLAKILLNHVELKIEGREIPLKYRSLGISGRNNYIAALSMVNRKINDALGKDRESASEDDFKKVLDNLDDILHPLQKQLRKAKNDYEKQQAEG